jgi:hypothetical protein
MSDESTFVLIRLEGERPSKGLITHSTTKYNVPGTMLHKILALLRSSFDEHTTPVQVFVKCPGVACIYAITSTKLEVRVLACDLLLWQEVFEEELVLTLLTEPR